MQIESILIFVAFVIISSLANRRKQAQQQQRQQRQQRQAEMKPAENRPKAQKPAAQRPGKRTLQDLFREMQQEMEAEYRRASEAARKPQQDKPRVKPADEEPFTYESTGSSTVAPGKARKDKPLKEPSAAQKRKSPIYRGEIGHKPRTAAIDLSEEAVLNGIIFSEILGKPKSLRS